MCLPPRQLAEALLFLRKAPAVKNVVKLHLQAPVWARLRLGKTLSTSELQILAHCYSQESTVGGEEGTDSRNNTRTRGKCLRLSIRTPKESSGCLVQGNTGWWGRGTHERARQSEAMCILRNVLCGPAADMYLVSISHRLDTEPGSFGGRQRGHL